MRVVIVSFLLGLPAFISQAQQFFPYLCSNGKYGICNSSGDLVTDCTYDFATFVIRYPDFITTRIGNGYGVVSSRTGQEIATPILSHSPHFETGKRYVRDGLLQRLIDTPMFIFSGYDMVVFNEHDHTQQSIIVDLTKYTTKALEHSPSRHIEFVDDLWKFRRKNGIINFYHRNGHVLLNNDVINAEIIDAHTMVVEGENGRLALADHNGTVRTGYVYNRVAAGGEGLYLINAENKYYFKNEDVPNRNAGVIKSDGTVLIDTIYGDIVATKDAWFIVRRNNRYGVYNQEGYLVYDTIYSKIEAGAKGHLIIHMDDKISIVDLNGTELTKSEKSGFKFNWPIEYYVTRDKDGNTYLLDQDLEQIYFGTFVNLSRIDDQSWLVFVKNGEFAWHDERGTENLDYKNIDIWYSESGAPRYLLLKGDSLWGLVDKDFNTILHTQFTDITEDRKGNRILAQNKLNGLYNFYDSTGRLLNEPPVSSPLFADPNRLYVRQTQNEETILLFRDGRKWNASEYVLDSKYSLPGGATVYICTAGEYKYVLNEDFYNITPSGFYIPHRFFDKDYMEHGLIPVFDEFRSGVITSSGAWAIPPSEHSYVPYSQHLIIRYYGRPKAPSPDGSDLLVKKDDTWESFHYLNITPHLDEHVLLVNDWEPGTRFRVWGVVDTLGNVILPLTRTEKRLSGKYLLSYEETSDSTGITSFFDRNGQLILTVPFKADMREGYMHITDPATHLSGAADTLGNIFIDPLYRGFSFNMKTRCFKYEIFQNGNTHHFLADASGTILIEDQSLYLQEIMHEEFYFLIAKTKGRTLVRSEDDSISTIFPVSFKKYYMELPHLIECKLTEESKPVWIDIRNGKAFMDLE